MIQVGVANLKASLSGYLARVKAGEVVTVTEHGRPIARICPLSPMEHDPRAYLADLDRQGVVRLGPGVIPDAFWGMERPADPEGRALAYVLDEREHGW